jgi:hypothetical protein
VHADIDAAHAADHEARSQVHGSRIRCCPLAQITGRILTLSALLPALPEGHIASGMDA